jgi:hypothetical protein
MHPAAKLLLDPNLLPETAGVYLAYFRHEAGLLAATQQIHRSDDLPTKLGEFDLLYLGASEDSIRGRILKHLKGDSRRSSLRRTVGVLLREQLSLSLCEAKRANFHFGDGEVRLSRWLVENSAFAFIETEDAFRFEKFLIQKLGPPLNLSHRRRHPFARTIMQLFWTLRGEPARYATRGAPRRRSELVTLSGRLPEQLIGTNSEGFGQSNNGC